MKDKVHVWIISNLSSANAFNLDKPNCRLVKPLRVNPLLNNPRFQRIVKWGLAGGENDKFSHVSTMFS